MSFEDFQAQFSLLGAQGGSQAPASLFFGKSWEVGQNQGGCPRNSLPELFLATFAMEKKMNLFYRNLYVQQELDEINIKFLLYV